MRKCTEKAEVPTPATIDDVTAIEEFQKVRVRVCVHLALRHFCRRKLYDR
jgi:hypothetical protein